MTTFSRLAISKAEGAATLTGETMNITINLHNMNALELATLETLLRRQHKGQLADEVAAEGIANAGDDYAECQGIADEYFKASEYRG